MADRFVVQGIPDGPSIADLPGLRDAINSHVRKFYEDLNAACWAALARGEGVRVEHTFGPTPGYTITVTPDVPAGTVETHGMGSIAPTDAGRADG